MLNKVGRDIPTNIPALEGREIYQGEFAIEPKAHRAGKPVHMSRVGTNKVLASIDEAIEKAGYVPGKDVVLAMDAASSEFYDKEKGVYVLADSGEAKKQLTK